MVAVGITLIALLHLKPSADTQTVLTIFGVILAVVVPMNVYFDSKKQEKIQAAMSLWENMWMIVNWLEGPEKKYQGWNSEGVENPLCILNWSTPLTEVSKTEDTALPLAWSMPGIMYLPREALESLTRLNQSVKNFNSYTELIRGFKLLASPLQQKILNNECIKFFKKYGGNITKTNVEELSSTISVDDKGLEAYRRLLVEMNQKLHRELVGDRKKEEAVFYNWKKLIVPMYASMKELGIVDPQIEDPNGKRRKILIEMFGAEFDDKWEEILSKNLPKYTS